jgi:hypothetical protein
LKKNQPASSSFIRFSRYGRREAVSPPTNRTTPSRRICDRRRPEVKPEQAPSVPAINYRITDETELGKGSETVKFRDNIAAIETLKKIEAEAPQHAAGKGGKRGIVAQTPQAVRLWQGHLK